MKGVIRLKVRAGLASAQPPLGPLLGQCGLNSREVVMEINRRCERYVEGTILKVVIDVKENKNYEIEVRGVLGLDLIKEVVGDSGYIKMTELYDTARIMSKELNLDIKSTMESVYSTLKSMNIIIKRNE